MKRLFTLVLAIGFSMVVSAQNYNMQLASHLPYTGGIQLANIGHYVDSLGNEYALVGTTEGLSIVNVTIPTAPVEVFAIAGPTSEWREVKTYRHYAYVTTEAGGGLQVIDLHALPAAPTYHLYTGDGSISGNLNSIHALHCDTATGYLYLYGSNISGGVPLFLNLNTDPYNPHYVGRYTYPGTGNAPYVHDGYVENDTAYFGHIYNGFFSVVDVTNKSNPVLLATQQTPGNFTHNTWLSSSNHHILFTTDEVTNSYLTAYDISDLSNIEELSRYQTDPGSNTIVHNTQIINDYAVTSWYTEGVVIVDEARPRNPIEVAKYDTYPLSNGGTFNGDWGVDPYLPSGTIVVSDIDNGLFVLTPTYMRGCYLEGVVTDSVTGALLQGATVQIISANNSTRTTDVVGEYRTGTVNANTYDVQFSKTGYYTKTISGVSLTNGVLTTLDVQLRCISCIAFTGHVKEAGTNNPIPGAQVLINSVSGQQVLTTDVSGNFSIPTLTSGNYDVVAGAWGYQTNCQNLDLSSVNNSVTIILSKGYYDDFSLNFGWTGVTQGANNWVRAIPVATNDNGATANPGNDVTGDCLGYCYVTNNGGGAASSSDVDPADGMVILTSPVFDLTTYGIPELHYSRWFYDGALNGNPPNDTMLVKLTNGITTVTLETIINTSAGNGSWINKSWNVASSIAPTANMRLIVQTSDALAASIVEGALDKFEVVDLFVGIHELSSSSLFMNVFPNPSHGTVQVSFHMNATGGSLTITDVAGREVERKELNSSSGKIAMGENLKSGIYFITLLDENNNKQVLKFVKTE